MRTAFIKTLTEMAGADERIHLVVGDIGFSVVEEFAERFPDRFLNAGVAEQSMTGVAAGLAIGGGCIVFAYSIANFPVMRCLEQIRNDVCYHNASVKIVAVGGGVSYGPLGYTHFAVEDLAVMRAMPGMVVAAPGDPIEAAIITRLACKTPGPWYIRLGKKGEPTIHTRSLRLQVGEALQVRDGFEGTVVATGAVLYEAWKAVQVLAREGRDLRLLSVPFVKPLDGPKILRASAETDWMLTVEEHNPYGGLGTAVSEVLAERGSGKDLKRLTLPERVSESGSQEYLRRRYGLDAEGIADLIRSELT